MFLKELNTLPINGNKPVCFMEYFAALQTIVKIKLTFLKNVAMNKHETLSS